MKSATDALATASTLGAGRPERAYPPQDAVVPDAAIIAALALIAAGAYGTVAAGYIPYADDWTFARSLDDAGAAFHPERQGVWRRLGLLLNGSAMTQSVPAYLGLIVALHAANAFLLYHIAASLGFGHAAVAVASLWAAFPGHHEAVAWLSATNVVWSAFFFLVALRLSLATSGEKPLLRSSAAFLAALTANLLHEQFAVALLLMPLAVACAAWGAVRRSIRNFLPALAAAAGAAAFCVAHLATAKPTTTKQLAFNPESLASPLFYQCTNLGVLEVWRFETWRAAGGHMLATGSGVAAVAALALGALWIALHVHRRLDLTSPPALLAWRVTGLGAILLIGCAAIYMAAGGYSFDSRKRYAFTIGLALVSLPFVAKLQPFTLVRTVALALLIAGLGTTTLLLTAARTKIVGALEDLRRSAAAGTLPSGLTIANWRDGPPVVSRWVWPDLIDAPWRDPLLLPLLAPAKAAAPGEPPTHLTRDWQADRWISPALNAPDRIP